jgi:hypothetical protein
LNPAASRVLERLAADPRRVGPSAGRCSKRQRVALSSRACGPLTGCCAQQDATDIYKRLLLEQRDFLALNVFVALCYARLDYFDVSQVSGHTGGAAAVWATDCAAAAWLHTAAPSTRPH